MKYQIIAQKISAERLFEGPALIVEDDIKTPQDAERLLNEQYANAVKNYPNNHVTVPVFWCFNVLRSKSEGDRTLINYKIKEVPEPQTPQEAQDESDDLYA